MFGAKASRDSGNTLFPEGSDRRILSRVPPHEPAIHRSMRVGTPSMYRSSTVTGKQRSPGRARALKPKEDGAPEPGTRRPRPENSGRSTPGAAVVPYASPTLTLIRVISGSRPGVSLVAAAHLTGVHPAMLLYYGRLGLLGCSP